MFDSAYSLKEPASELKSHKLRIVGVFNVLALIVGVIGLGVHNLGNHYFWTDESSSFFTALGWPAPGQPAGGWQEIQQTLITFLDPGLFHVLIRIWAEIFGTSIVALRSLPFAFFVVYVLGLLLWYRSLRIPMFIGAAGVAIMMIDNITPYYAVEVRAYSASMAAAVVLPLAAWWLISRPTLSRFAGFLALAAFFGAMQYTAVSVNLATSLVLLLAVFGTRAWPSRGILLASSAFLALWLPAIYLITRGLPATGAEADLDHVRTLVLAYMDPATLTATLRVNFLSPTAFPRTLFVGAVAVTLIANLLMRDRSAWLTRLRQALSPQILFLWVYVTAMTASAGLISAAGFLPWVVGTRWSITEIAGIALSIVGLIAWASRVIQTRRSFAIAALALLTVVVTLGGSARLWMYERPGDSEALASLMPALMSGNPNMPVLIDYWIFPDTRYWVEYSGELDGYRQGWINRGVESTGGYVPADSQAILEFLSSDSDRMLLRDDRAVEALGAARREEFDVVRTLPKSLGKVAAADAPVVLVKLD